MWKLPFTRCLCEAVTHIGMRLVYVGSPRTGLVYARVLSRVSARLDSGHRSDERFLSRPRGGGALHLL